MQSLYAIIECKTIAFDKQIFQDLDAIKNKYVKYVNEWIERTVTDYAEPRYNNCHPVLVRLSDGAELYSVSDILPDVVALHNDRSTKLRQFRVELFKLQDEYDKNIDNIVTKMMNQVPTAPNHMQPATYNIVQNVNGELMICGNTCIDSLTFEHHKKEYAKVATKWFRDAVEDYNNKEWIERPPVLMRLSDAVVLYSVLDFLPEVKVLYDEFKTKKHTINENLARLQAEYKETVEAMVDELVWGHETAQTNRVAKRRKLHINGACWWYV